jgi:hypothetical protein
MPSFQKAPKPFPVTELTLNQAQVVAENLHCSCWVVDVPGSHTFAVVKDLAEAPAGHRYVQPFHPSPSPIREGAPAA